MSDARDLRLPATPPPPGRLVAVAGRSMHARLLAGARPTIVFEPGFGSASVEWWAIGDALAAAGHAVLLYDRAGYGWSSPATDARSPAEIAADLHLLLAEIAPPPYVLVGHSAGGLYVRAFARAHLPDVAGMVLIESSSEAQNAADTGVIARLLVPPLLYGGLIAPRWWQRRSLRAGADQIDGGPYAELAAAAWLARDRRTLLRELRAIRRLRASDAFLQPGALGERPLIVLTAAMPADSAAQSAWWRWQTLQGDLAQLSRNGRQVIAPRGGHNLQRDAPESVIATILDVCAAT